MKKPYLSVIIPCLNEENFLPHLLKNLNSQIFTNFEVIVIDGNSEDKTAQIVKNFKSKYPLFLYSTATRNVGFQRNLGAQKSHGEILIFFDADTQIPKNYLKKIASAFKTQKPDFLTTYLKVNSIKPIEKIYASMSNLIFDIGKIAKSGYSFGSMQAVKHSVFNDINGYDTETKFREDSQLFEKLSNQGYKYLLLKNPKYIFSMRRFQLNGTFKPLIQQLAINMDVLFRGYHNNHLGKKYQMGGKRYSSK
jgi:glycosyltransferase involved in cell wall biosynthesis